MYQYYFFDLDGTLTDSGEGIINSILYALNKYGIQVEDRSELLPFIGPPLADSFMRLYHFDQKKAEEAVAFYREYFREKGIYENAVYPGIRTLLAELKAQGKKIVLATSKPEEFALIILKHFHLYDYFDLACGATMDSSRSHKTDVIAYAVRQTGAADRSQILMIGDRDNDILGAKDNGLDSVGVLYGYGSEEELRIAGADYIVRSPVEILKIPPGLR